MSYDPHQPPPHQPPYQPPPIYVQQPSNKAAAVGVWILVLWFVGPALLLVLCCAGCLGLGGWGAIIGETTPTPSPSVTSSSR